MTTTTPAAGPDALAAFDLGYLPKMLGAGDTPEDVHYLDLLQCAIQGYRHDLQTPEVRVGNIAETAGDVARLSQELAKAVLRLAEQVKAIETPGFFSPSRGDVSADFLDAAPEIAASMDLLGNVAAGVSKEVDDALGSFPDKGGSAGIKSRLIGSPKALFIGHLVTVWEHFHGTAPARAEGPFYNFVRAAHTLATGKPNASIERLVKRIPAEARRRREAFEAGLDRISELRRMAAAASPEEAARLHREACELSEKVFGLV